MADDTATMIGSLIRCVVRYGERGSMLPPQEWGRSLASRAGRTPLQASQLGPWWFRGTGTTRLGLCGQVQPLVHWALWLTTALPPRPSSSPFPSYSLISKSQIRYEGVLVQISIETSAITLSNGEQRPQRVRATVQQQQQQSRSSSHGSVGAGPAAPLTPTGAR
jgi:hypothetical protein